MCMHVTLLRARVRLTACVRQRCLISIWIFYLHVLLLFYIQLYTEMFLYVFILSCLSLCISMFFYLLGSPFLRIAIFGFYCLFAWLSFCLSDSVSSFCFAISHVSCVGSYVRVPFIHISSLSLPSLLSLWSSKLSASICRAQASTRPDRIAQSFAALLSSRLHCSWYFLHYP